MRRRRLGARSRRRAARGVGARAGRSRRRRRPCCEQSAQLQVDLKNETEAQRLQRQLEALQRLNAVVAVDVVDDRPQPQRHEPVGALAAAAAGRPTEHEPERAALSACERDGMRTVSGDICSRARSGKSTFITSFTLHALAVGALDGRRRDGVAVLRAPACPRQCAGASPRPRGAGRRTARRASRSGRASRARRSGAEADAEAEGEEDAEDRDRRALALHRREPSREVVDEVVAQFLEVAGHHVRHDARRLRRRSVDEAEAGCRAAGRPSASSASGGRGGRSARAMAMWSAPPPSTTTRASRPSADTR